MTTAPQAAKSATHVAALLVMPLFVAACESRETPAKQATADHSSTDGSSRESSPSRNQQASPATQGTNTEDQMRIEITIGDQRFKATLDDSPASSDLIAQLPLTLEMDDHGSVEKTGALPASLSLQGQPAGADPEVGDVGYYAPGSDFVLYYGDQSYYDGIVILGHLDGDAAERIADMDGSIAAAVAILDE